eukprot:scaffold88792_cov64-Phaeocystis_antarctica.AAC.4
MVLELVECRDHAALHLAEAVETSLAVVADADAPGAALPMELLHRTPLGLDERTGLRRGAAAHLARRRRVQQHRVDEIEPERREVRA